MARRLAAIHNTELLVDTTGYSATGEPRPRELRSFVRPLSLFRFRIKARAATESEVRRLKDDYLTSSTLARVVRLVRRLQPGFLWKMSHIVEHGYRFQAEALSFPDNVYVQGFWQSEKYFADIAPLIRQELQPLERSPVQWAEQRLKKLKARYGQVVSLHVRRGDLAHAHEVLGRKDIVYGAPISRRYIEQTMQQFDDDVCFLVFSDTQADIDWCRENIRARNIEFSLSKSELRDFCAMSLCDHHIIANSTFSWWAAWLNAKPGRRVIAPRTWSGPEAPADMPTEDLMPKNWELL
jgi:hypothetical protein